MNAEGGKACLQRWWRTLQRPVLLRLVVVDLLDFLGSLSTAGPLAT